MEVAGILCEAGANPSAVMTNDFTPLDFCAEFNHVVLAEVLCSYGAEGRTEAAGQAGRGEHLASADREGAADIPCLGSRQASACVAVGIRAQNDNWRRPPGAAAPHMVDGPLRLAILGSSRRRVSPVASLALCMGRRLPSSDAQPRR